MEGTGNRGDAIRPARKRKKSSLLGDIEFRTAIIARENE
jgi:hypothetical protein